TVRQHVQSQLRRSPGQGWANPPGQSADGRCRGDRGPFRRHSRLERLMDAFTRHTGLVAPLDHVDVDTDQIIPKQFLKSIARTGFEAGLFYDWRMLADGSPNPDFVLNKPEYQGASILVSGRNFGSGSSREHAPWALQQAGFRAVIAPSFGDIFRNNCYQNGLLPVALPESIVRQLLDRAENEPGYRLTIHLDHQTVADERDTLASFDIDPSVKHRILKRLNSSHVSISYAVFCLKKKKLYS